MEEALNNLTEMFPSLDRPFLEDVYVSSKKDLDKTIDTLLSMGVEINVDKKQQQKPAAPTPAPVPQQQQQQQQQQQAPRPPTNVSHYGYPNPSSPVVPLNHYNNNNSSLTPAAPLTPPLTPTTLTPTPNHHPSLSPPPSHLVNSGYQPRMDMFHIPATPPPINMSSSSMSAPPQPTAPPAITKLNDSQMDQKRSETVKQELALEYQRISEKHKYNLELQQKLEQLSEFNASEQRKLGEQRAVFDEEKRRFTEELSTRFKALQDENARQVSDIKEREDRKAEQEQRNAEEQRVSKEQRKIARAQKRDEAEQLRLAAEEEAQQKTDMLTARLEESRAACENLESQNSHLSNLNTEYEATIDDLRAKVAVLEARLEKTAEDASAEVLSYFSTVVSTLADGIHAVSMKRANKGAGDNSDNNEEVVDPVVDLKRTFLSTVQDSLGNKLRDLE